MENTNKEYECYDFPVSHTIRIIGSFAILFHYRSLWMPSSMSAEYTKIPIKTTIVDDNLNILGEDISLVKDDEELFSYLLFIYNNSDNFNELYCTTLDSNLIGNRAEIMEQIVAILNKRFA